MNNRIFIISFISFASIFCQSQAEADVLGRTKCVISEDFESSDWVKKNYRNNVTSTGFWHTSQRGGPDSLLPILLSINDKPGNGLEMRTTQRDVASNGLYPQVDLLTPIFSEKWGVDLGPEQQPVFLARIFVPVLAGESGHFGFRLNAHDAKTVPYLKDIGWSYQPGIWIRYDGNAANFFFRAANGNSEDIPGFAATPGWWTLAIAYDDKGGAHYYVVQGRNIPSTQKEECNTYKFQPHNQPFMADVIDGFLALTYHEKTDSLSPPFIIDDFEVWVIEKP